ncbi:MAG: hypothetical protein ACRDHF_00260, partial [Tepidiformaceae bacterium]
MPERVAMAPVDLDPSNECVRVVTMAFVRGTEPELPCGAQRQAIMPEIPTPLPPLMPEPMPIAPGLNPSSGPPPGASLTPGPAPPPPPPGRPPAGLPAPSTEAPGFRGPESELPPSPSMGSVRESR